MSVREPIRVEERDGGWTRFDRHGRGDGKGKEGTEEWKEEIMKE